MTKSSGLTLSAALAVTLLSSYADSALAIEPYEYDSMAVVWAENSIKANLRDPDSFEWAEGARSWHVYHGKHGIPVVVCAHFRAKNGFGGYNDSYAAVALILAKGDFDNSPVNLNPSPKSWKQVCRNL